MLNKFVKKFSALIVIFKHFLLRLYQFITKPQENLVEGERETIEWCKERLGFNGLEELWEKGAHKVSNLLEDDSKSWMEVHATAVRKINISPVMDLSQLSSPFLERSARQNFVFFLNKIIKFSERDVLKDVAMRVSEDIMARGVGLYAAYTRRRAVFYVYSVSGKLDNINVSMRGQSALRIKTKEKMGRLMVGYIAYAKGTYFIFVSKNGWVAPGCPFEVSVDDPPPGYRGSFGASEWSESEESAGSPAIEVEKYEVENERNQERKRTFLNMVQNILNGKRIFTFKKSEIPKIKTGDPDRSAFSTCSSTDSGPDRLRRRSFTFISSEGATFPLDLSSREDSKFFDTFDNLDIFKNDHSDIWAVQAEGDSITSSEHLAESLTSSGRILSYTCYSLENKHDIGTELDKAFSNASPPKNTANEWKGSTVNLLKHDFFHNVRREQMSNYSCIDDIKLNSLPSIDRQESASETSVSDKIIEVAITENFECKMKKNDLTLFGQRRCKSIMSLFDLKESNKSELRRVKSSFSRFTGVYDKLGSKGNGRTFVVKIGEYCVNKEEVKSDKTVKKLKSYWDNLTVKKVREPKMTRVKPGRKVANIKLVFEQLAKQNAEQTVKQKKREQTNDAYDFSDEKYSTSVRHTHKEKSGLISRSLERDLRGLFEDMNHGIGLPGIPNRLALLASLRSIEKQSVVDEPLLSTKRPLDFRRRPFSKSPIPGDQFFTAY